MTKPKITEANEALMPALNDLQGLQKAYDDAKHKEDAARRDVTDAVNRLNQKQKEIDALIADLRAASDGDWKTKYRNSGV